MASTFNNAREGDRIPDLQVKMDRETYFEYNKLVKEINPLHFNEAYARSLGFRDIVVAGVYTFSFIPKMLEDWAGAPGVCRSIELRFMKPAYINDVVTYRGAVTRRYVKDNCGFIEFDIHSENQDGMKLIEATAVIKTSGHY